MHNSNIRYTNGKVVELYTECPSSDNSPFPFRPNTVVICSNPFESEPTDKTINFCVTSGVKNSTLPIYDSD